MKREHVRCRHPNLYLAFGVRASESARHGSTSEKPDLTLVGLDILLGGARRNVGDCVQVDRGGCVRRDLSRTTGWTSVGRRSCFPLNVESCTDPCMDRFRILRRFIQSEARCSGDLIYGSSLLFFSVRDEGFHLCLDPDTHTAAAELVPQVWG